jgi:hypothetical protein
VPPRTFDTSRLRDSPHGQKVVLIRAAQSRAHRGTWRLRTKVRPESLAIHWTRRLDLVHNDGALFTSVFFEVSLTVSVHIEPADRHLSVLIRPREGFFRIGEWYEACA